MKKALLYITAALGFCFGVASCAPEELVNDTDVARHQIENLTCVADDEEVTLSWSVPEGWEPTDYLITYNDAQSVGQKIYTEGATTYTITGLVNNFDYIFNVQAVYGKAIAKMVSVKAKPVTSRISVKSLAYTASSENDSKQYIEITWEKPSDKVQNYTLTYYPEMNDKNVKTETIAADKTSYKIENITRDDNYVISLVANYPKGAAAAAQTTVYFKIAYFVSQTSGAIGQTIDFKFNMEAYPTATDIKWELPGGVTETGANASWSINTTGDKEAILSAKVGDKVITWPAIKLNLRAKIVEAKDFKQSGTAYNGFKGSYPIFSPDGKTVYGITFNKISGLYAYDLVTGAEKWRFVPEVDGASYNPGTVNPVTGDIYYGTTVAGQFYCVSPEGQLKWEYKNAGSMKSTAPAVSADGSVVYLADLPGKLMALNAADGTEKWVKDLGTPGFSMLINGDELIVAHKDLKVRFFNRNTGDELSSIDVSKQPADIAGFAVADDKKTIYVPLNGGGLACIDIAEKKLISENIFATNNVWVPVVASNGDVVAGSKDCCVYGLSADLKEVKWKFEQGAGAKNAFNYCHLCADNQGRVYITSGGDLSSKVYVFNAADGTVLSSEASGETSAYKQMGGNNFLNGFLYSGYIGAGSENGPLVGHYFGGERKFWGGPGGDICGSSCLQSPLL